MVLPFILIQIPFLALNVLTTVASWKIKRVHKHPATLASWLYVVTLIQSIISLLLITFMYSSMHYGEFSRFTFYLHRAMTFTGPACTLGLIFCAFAWRKKNNPSNYKHPLIFVGLWIGSIALHILLTKILFGFVPPSDTGAPRVVISFLSIPLILISLAGMVSLFWGIFGGRGYSVKEAILQKIEPTAPVAPQATTQANETPSRGMFEESDYIPYIFGVMVFGGLIVVPILWGGFMNMSYDKSILPSLISCFIFAFCHDKRGNFIFERFFKVMLLVVLAIMRSFTKYSQGGGKPFFIAGGFLGFIVMFLCGWAAVLMWRQFRKVLKF